MVFKHLIFCGGGPSFFSLLGCIKHLYDNKLFHIDNIETIYGTSSGAILSLFVSLIKLGLSFDEIVTYMVSRSWNILVSENILDFKAAFDNRGLFNENIVHKSISPLLQTVGLNNDITMKELFDKTNIKLVMYSVNINTQPFEKIVISHETFPDLPVFKGLYMSMTIPGLFTPLFIDDKCFVDGGFLCNYPYNDCQTDNQASDDEIIGLKVDWGDYTLKIDETQNLISYMSTFFRMMSLHIYDTANTLSPTSNTVECLSPDTGGPAKWVDIFVNPEVCKEFVECGVKSAISYMHKKQIININETEQSIGNNTNNTNNDCQTEKLEDETLQDETLQDD